MPFGSKCPLVEKMRAAAERVLSPWVLVALVLVATAIEYGSGAPVEVAVDCRPEQVRVTVTDHGVGLDPRDADRVFERFWRADPSRRRTLGGTGLGLATPREDARLHGGDLTVAGARGAGCTFTLALPRSAVHN